MRIILLICVGFIVFNLKAQTLPCDSCVKQNLQHLKDSSSRALQEKSDATRDQVTGKLNSQSASVKGKVKSQWTFEW